MGKKTLVALGALVVLAGCGSLTHGQYDVVRFNTLHRSGFVEGAQCSVQIGKHQFRVVTPSSATLPRGSRMTVACSHPTAGTGSKIVGADGSSASLFGNALLAPNPLAAGLLSGFEGMSGAGSDWPDLVTVTLIGGQAARIRVVPLDPSGLPIEAACTFQTGGQRWLVPAPGEVTMDMLAATMDLRCQHPTHGEAEVVLAARLDGTYPAEVRFRFPAPNEP